MIDANGAEFEQVHGGLCITASHGNGMTRDSFWCDCLLLGRNHDSSHPKLERCKLEIWQLVLCVCVCVYIHDNTQDLS